MSTNENLGVGDVIHENGKRIVIQAVLPKGYGRTDPQMDVPTDRLPMDQIYRQLPDPIVPKNGEGSSPHQ